MNTNFFLNDVTLTVDIRYTSKISLEKNSSYEICRQSLISEEGKEKIT